MVTHKEVHNPLPPQNSFFREKIHGWLLGISALFWVLGFVIVWYGIGKREAAIVLHYNVYFGIDILGAWWQAYLVPLSGVGIWMVHVLLSWRFFQMGEWALSRVALLSLLFLESMTLIAIIAISLVNY